MKKLLALQCVVFLALIKVLREVPDLSVAAADGLAVLIVLMAAAIVAIIIVASLEDRRP